MAERVGPKPRKRRERLLLRIAKGALLPADGYTAKKVCKQCGGDKCIPEFKTDSRLKSGVASICKACDSDNKRKKYAKNPENMRMSSAAYRKKNIETVRIKEKERSARRYAEDPRKHAEFTKAWRDANKEKSESKSREWKQKNRDKVARYERTWRERNPDSVRVKTHNRRAKKRENGGRLSIGLSELLFKAQKGKCACGCRRPLGDDYHMDHIVPIALGGANSDENIQLLRAGCNLEKGAQHPVDFMQKRGFLL